MDKSGIKLIKFTPTRQELSEVALLIKYSPKVKALVQQMLVPPGVWLAHQIINKIAIINYSWVVLLK